MPASQTRFGPGILVTAAFIGPGTITTASLAGAGYGFALCWALLFSVIATFILQEMAARLGMVSGKGLSENLQEFFTHLWFRPMVSILIITAIGFGNAAYESGNILGASLGLQTLFGWSVSFWALAVAILAGALLAVGQYRLIQGVMVVLVLVMSVVFLLTMIMVKPSITVIMSGLLIPKLPENSLLTVLALIGTTVVPYNLFLHASITAKKWKGNTNSAKALRFLRWEIGLLMGIGGLITFAVMCISAVAFFGTDNKLSVATMAQQLKPLLGSFAPYVFATGLFAAGLSSAITAPLAASFAVSGILRWPNDLKDLRFRLVWITVLVSGAVLCTMGIKPLTAILFAQAANAILLPFCAIFLLAVMNKKKILGNYCNSTMSNVIGVLIVMVIIGLSLFKFAKVFGVVD